MSIKFEFLINCLLIVLHMNNSFHAQRKSNVMSGQMSLGNFSTAACSVFLSMNEYTLMKEDREIGMTVLIKVRSHRA